VTVTLPDSLPAVQSYGTPCRVDHVDILQTDSPRSD